jgi:hypothetical protein
MQNFDRKHSSLFYYTFTIWYNFFSKMNLKLSLPKYNKLIILPANTLAYFTAPLVTKEKKFKSIITRIWSFDCKHSSLFYHTVTI